MRLTAIQSAPCATYGSFSPMTSPRSARPATPAGNARSARMRSIMMIAIFDIAGPLVAYSLLRSAGLSAVSALIISGVFPAAGVAIGIVTKRRVDAIGIFVLAGIAVGTVFGLVSHNARLVLVEGSVPTGFFGLICLGSLWAKRPLMYRFALEFMGGPETQRGKDFDDLWQYEGFRQTFKVLTAAWGIGYLIEAAVRVVITENTSTGMALTASKVLPFAFAGVLAAWTVLYGRRQKRKGERLAAAAASQQTPDQRTHT